MKRSIKLIIMILLILIFNIFISVNNRVEAAQITSNSVQMSASASGDTVTVSINFSRSNWKMSINY